jgi:hypothetical protein
MITSREQFCMVGCPNAFQRAGFFLEFRCPLVAGLFIISKEEKPLM